MRQIEKITTGFLVGNLFNDESGIDVDSSANAFALAIHEELAAEYPGAEIKVSYQDASGATPYPLETHVYLEGDEPDFTTQEAIEAEVNWIKERIYQRFDWIVELEGVNQ